MHYYIAFMEAAAREKLEEPTSRARNWQFSELFLHKHHLLIKWAIFYALCGCIFLSMDVTERFRIFWIRANCTAFGFMSAIPCMGE
jgi:hypothetical protein